MELPPSLTSSLFKEKAIFYFISDQVNAEPHYFVLLKNHQNKLLLFSCCTSNYNTVYRYIKINNYDEATMASIDYNNYPFLKVPTFINCNSKIEYPFDEFEELYKKGKAKYMSDISNKEYKDIIKGILLSDDIEEEVKGWFK